MMSAPTCELHLADCRSALPTLSPESIDLVVTSPPYAQKRYTTYGGVPANRYVEWFLPIAADLHRILHPAGSFVLNIKEHAEHGERHPYVYELVLAMRHAGWRLVDEYIWHKPNGYPGRWPDRLRDGFERLYHFAKQSNFRMFPEAVRVPIGDWTKKAGGSRTTSRINPQYVCEDDNWLGRELVFPTNVLTLSVGGKNYGHSAVFPIGLPEFFIKLFTQAGAVVLDPFMGSGTTGAAAMGLGRSFIGIDSDEASFAAARDRLAQLGLREVA